MGRISDSDRARNEDAIRAAMDRILRGELPPAASATSRPWLPRPASPGPASTRRRTGTAPPVRAPTSTSPRSSSGALWLCSEAGEIVDPRAAQIERLKAQVAELKDRVTKRDEALAELTAFKTLAVSRIAAQHAEIERLREQAAALGNVRHLPAARSGTAPYGSCN